MAKVFIGKETLERGNEEGFVGIPLYTLKEVVDNVRMSDIVAHAKDLDEMTLGFMVPVGTTELKGIKYQFNVVDTKSDLLEEITI